MNLNPPLDLLPWVRAHCVTDPKLLAVIILGNAWISVSYLRIPRTLRRILHRVGGKITGGGEVRGFANFVASCGFTHVFSVLVLFLPSLDWIAAVWVVWTGYISWRTDRLIRQREDVLVRAILDAHTLEMRMSNDLGTPPQALVPDR